MKKELNSYFDNLIMKETNLTIEFIQTSSELVEKLKGYFESTENYDFSR